MNETMNEKSVFVVRAVDSWLPRPCVYEELKNGRARIGWSSEDCQDLRLLKKVINDRDPLNNHQQESKRCLRFLTAVKPGDFFIYPHQPNRGQFSVVEIKGDYYYSPSNQDLEGNFRSYRPCSLTTKNPIDIHDEIVPSQLRFRLGRPGRFSKISDTEIFWRFLRKIDDAGTIENQSSHERVKRIYEELKVPLSNELYREFSQTDLSRRFCHELFNKMGYSAEIQEGPAEAGSDVVVTVGDWLLGNVTFRVGVQVFAYKGDIAEGDFREKLMQLLNGWETNTLDFGALLTTGHCTEDARETLNQHNMSNPDKLVHLIEGKQLSDVFLKFFPPEIEWIL